MSRLVLTVSLHRGHTDTEKMRDLSVPENLLPKAFLSLKKNEIHKKVFSMLLFMPGCHSRDRGGKGRQCPEWV